MEIIDQRTIFNNEFNYYIQNDRSDYLNKLIKFLSEENHFELPLTQRIEEFQKGILEYILSIETEDDYEEDIDDIRKNRVSGILFNINNYLISLSPADAVDKFMNGDFKSLIRESDLYTEMYKKRLVDKLKIITENNSHEINGLKIFKTMIEQLYGFIEGPTTDTIRYGSMRKNILNINENTPFIEIESYIDDILCESYIISKFPIDGRRYIAKKLEDANSSHDKKIINSIDANICESILINYTLLSLYSDNPERLRVSENMLKTLMYEITSGTISRGDILDAIIHGNIKFNSDELEYIKANFINKLFSNGEKTILPKDTLIKLVK